MDWRKNSSSSTIAINGAFDNRPSGARAKSPQHGRFKRCRASNAKSIGDEESRRGKPGAAKLWFMPFGRRRVYFCNGMCLTPMSSHLRIGTKAVFRGRRCLNPTPLFRLSTTIRRCENPLGGFCDLSAWKLGYLRPFPTSSTPTARTVPPASSWTSDCRGGAVWIFSASSPLRISKSRSSS